MAKPDERECTTGVIDENNFVVIPIAGIVFALVVVGEGVVVIG